MAPGLIHDQTIKACTLPIGVLISIIWNIQIGLFFTIAFFLGGLWLSPDLDTISNPLKRWGFLQNLWWPYRKIIKHRSIFSHGVLIGTTIRFVYLIGILTLTIYAINQIFNIELIPVIHSCQKLVILYPEESVAIFVGVEASAWVHLIQDRTL